MGVNIEFIKNQKLQHQETSAINRNLKRSKEI